MKQKILIRNVQIVQKAVFPRCDIYIADGIIQEVAAKIERPADVEIDGSSLTALPGLFDMHVHLRDPGQTHKEDILTGAAAALAGGVTGVGCITMGLQGETLCDYDALKEAGICAISDDGRPVECAETMRQALQEAYQRNIPVISHCEDLSIIHGGIVNHGVASDTLHVKGMDRSSEDYITAREIILAATTNTAIHIAHVSTSGSVEIVRLAKAHGVQVTCETCPHYFLMTEEAVLCRDADYRMNPPLRTEEDRKAVLAGVLDGTIDCIVTDHAPHSPEEKADFEHAPNGVIGMETSLAASLKLVHAGLMTLPELVEKMDPEKMHSKAKNVICKGKMLQGKAVLTITDGEVRYQDAQYFQSGKE